ncbi:MAG: permease [Verrucomicrobia bacterium]|nr:permease [Verrucomicrobiota bacterium]
MNWLETFWRDVRFSARSLRKSKPFSLAVIITLALCIWGNTAVLSVLYGLVIKPLPFPDADQVVDVYNSRPKAGQMVLNVGIPQYLDYKKNADLFSSVSMWTGWMFNIGEESGTERYVGMKVTSEYFTVLGLPPLLGRYFTPDECVPGHDNVAVVTQSYWEKEFHGDAKIVGQQVRLSGTPVTIVGVLPRSFEQLTTAPVLMMPYVWRPEQEDPRRRLNASSSITARIKPGVSHGAALAQLQTLEDRNRDTVADPQLREHMYAGGHRMGLIQLRAQQTEKIKDGLLLLQGGAAFVLLLGCVNVASLMLARANGRAAEFAVRQALGASRWMLARQLLTEATLLALTGATIGLGLAWASLRVINRYTDAISYGIPPVRVDGGLIALTLLVSFIVALLIGSLPLLQIWRAGPLQGAIQSGTRGASRGGGIRALSGLLVITQVALALLLLVGAGLLLRSFSNVMAISPGFDARKVIHARIAYDGSYTDPAKLQGLQDRLLERMREIPGVESVAYSDRLPGFSDVNPMTLPIRGMPAGHDGTYPMAAGYRVSPEYFPTMGIRLLEGRNFTAADQRPGARWVVIVDRKFAERYFPHRSPLGETFTFGPPNQKPEESPVIIGVAETARVNGLEDKNRLPYVYITYNDSRGGLSVELRTNRSFADIMREIRQQVKKVDPTLPIYQAMTLQDQLDKASANRRGVLWLLGIFAGIALLLSAVGIYGMLAYDVTQRTREIGIRGAIGATRGQIIALILRQGLSKAGVGLAIGLAGALALSRMMGSLLYEVQSSDPLVFSVVAGLVVLVAFVASWLPALRAAKVDPIVALRYE